MKGAPKGASIDWKYGDGAFEMLSNSTGYAEGVYSGVRAGS